ncbi:MAG: hypothetical protein AB1435_10360 [Chloroflexota bacterium]|jgi:hypothetical protein
MNNIQPKSKHPKQASWADITPEVDELCSVLAQAVERILDDKATDGNKRQ